MKRWFSERPPERKSRSEERRTCGKAGSSFLARLADHVSGDRSQFRMGATVSFRENVKSPSLRRVNSGHRTGRWAWAESVHAKALPNRGRPQKTSCGRATQVARTWATSETLQRWATSVSHRLGRRKGSWGRCRHHPLAPRTHRGHIPRVDHRGCQMPRFARRLQGRPDRFE